MFVVVPFLLHPKSSEKPLKYSKLGSDEICILDYCRYCVEKGWHRESLQA